MSITKYIFIFISIFIVIKTQAQYPYISDITTTKHFGMMQDVALAPDGTVFLASDRGGLWAYTYNGSSVEEKAHIYDNGRAMAVAVSTNGTVFVANWDDGLRAYSYDGNSFINTAHINEGGFTEEIAVGSSATVFIINGEDGRATDRLIAYRYDGDSFEQLASLEISRYCDEITVAPDGTLFLAMGGDGLKACIFDGSSFTFKASVNDPGQARGVAVGNDGTVFLANSAGGLYAYDYDGSSFSQIGHIDDGYAPDVALGPGNTVYIAAEYDGLRAYTWDGSSFQIAGNRNDGGHAWTVAADKDGTVYLISEFDGLRVYSYNGSSFAHKGFISNDGSAWQVALGSYGTVFLANFWDGLLAYTYNGSSFSETAHIDDKGEVRQVAVGPDGTVFVVSDRDTVEEEVRWISELIAYSYDGSSFSRLAHLGDQVRAVAVGDGTVFVARAIEDGSILSAYSFDGYSFTETAHILTGYIDRINVGPDGSVFIINSEGLTALGYDGHSFTQRARLNADDGRYISDIDVDQGGTVFAACGEDGLYAYYYDGSSFTPAGFTDNIWTSYVDIGPDGMVFIVGSNENGFGIIQYRYDNSAFRKITHVLSEWAIESVEVGQDGIVYIANAHYGLRVYNYLEGRTDITYHPADSSVCYTVTDDSDADKLIKLDPETGHGTLIGYPGVPDLQHIAINPTGDIYGTDNFGYLHYINAESGKMFFVSDIGLGSLEAMAFGRDGILYVTKDGDLYSVIPESGIATQINSTGINLKNITLDPTDNTFWGFTADSIYIIDLQTGDDTPVFSTFYLYETLALHFDVAGNLFALVRKDDMDYLASIDKTTGQYSLIGETDFESAATIAFYNVPLDGIHIRIIPRNIDLGLIEIGDSVSRRITVSNIGTENLMVSNISDPAGPFFLVDPPSTPKTITSGNSESFKVTFNSPAAEIYNTSFIISSDDSERPYTDILLSAEGLFITPADFGAAYAFTNRSGGNTLLQLNPITGAGSSLVPLEIPSLTDMAINSTGEIFACDNLGQLYKTDVESGRTLHISDPGLGSMKSMVFAGNDSLYAVVLPDYLPPLDSTYLYTIDLMSGTSDRIAKMGVSIYELAFNPVDGTLWGSYNDSIYIIDKISGSASFIGNTKHNYSLSDMSFDIGGNLYAIERGFPLWPPASWSDNLLSIDKTNGEGTVIGSIDFSSVNGLVFFNAPMEGRHITVVPPHVNFGNLEPGKAKSKSIAITNNGSEDVTITHISATGAPFFLNSSPELPVILSSTQSEELTITFSVADSGIFNDSLTITNDSEDWPLWVIKLQGSSGILVNNLANENNKVPEKCALDQNWPNPFNSISNFEFRISKFSHVNLSIYNILGQKVATLVDKKRPAGSYQVQWDASNFASGVYLYRLSAGDFTETRKLILMK